MRYLRFTLALLALPSTILAVSLSDFTPRVSDLPSSCEAIYTQTISGCSASDFSSSSCSKGCVQALNAFTSKVKTACGNKGIDGGNIITTFLSGGGPAGLCSNADAVLGGSLESSAASSSAAATSKATSSSSASSSSASSTSPSDSTSSSSKSSSSAVLSGTATATSLASSTSASDGGSSSGILVDTLTVPTTTPTSTSSSSGNSQTNMDDNSGGGSPFDSEGNMNSLASLTTSCSFTTILLATGMVLFATLR